MAGIEGTKMQCLRNNREIPSQHNEHFGRKRFHGDHIAINGLEHLFLFHMKVLLLLLLFLTFVAIFLDTRDCNVENREG